MMIWYRYTHAVVTQQLCTRYADLYMKKTKTWIALVTNSRDWQIDNVLLQRYVHPCAHTTLQKQLQC